MSYYNSINNLNNKDRHFSEKAIKTAFLDEIYSWDISNEIKQSFNPNNQNKFYKNILEFNSSGDYIDHWCNLLFTDLKSKLHSSINDSIRKRFILNLFECSKIEKYSNFKVVITIFMDSNIAHQFDMNRNSLIYITTKLEMDRSISSYSNSNSNRPLFPRKGIICSIKNTKISSFSGTRYSDGSVKPPPLEIEIETKSNSSFIDTISSFFRERYSFNKFDERKFNNLIEERNKEKKCWNIEYSNLVLVPLGNLQNKLRQFRAVVNVDKIQLRNEILCPSLHDNRKIKQNWTKTPINLRKKFKKELNESQYKSVKNAVQSKGIKILQGPPGTGKTRTVIALLNILHINAFNKYYSMVIDLIKNVHEINKNSSQTLMDKKTDLKNISFHNLLDFKGIQSRREVDIQKNKPKILVCAPSNAAVDEIISRLAHIQLFDNEERLYTPRMIRIGTSTKIRDNVQFHLTLNKNVESFFKYEKKELEERIEEYKNKLVHINHSITERQRRFIHFHSTMELEKNEEEAKFILKLYEDRHQIKLETLRLKWVNSEIKEKAKEKLEKSFLEEAEIVFSTLNGAGSKEMRSLSRGFDFCIVDEAAQCVEPDLLIPLGLSVESVILVGDHRQLPPTVFMSGPLSLQFEKSMFERFQVAGFHSKHLLNTQYRMHPEISQFPSKKFYSSELKNGKNVMQTSYNKVYHLNENFLPFLFFDIQEGNESRSGFSLFNKKEAQFVVLLLEDLCREYGPSVLTNVGVITPYREQMNVIRLKINESLILKNFLISKVIEIATIDFFQGREKNIIILSCVRASNGGSSIGFLSSVRRLNVSLTRAKYALWVIGNSESLSKSEIWKELISDSKQRKLFKKVDFVKPLNSFQNYYNEIPRNYNENK